jgi:flagellar hook assembly protein FlgD
MRFGTYGRGIWDYQVEPATAVQAEQISVAFGFDLRNAPNPFNPRTTVNFRLEQPANVRLVVHDLAGREVTVLLASAMAPGEHQAVWDGKDSGGRSVASGAYLVRLMVDDRSETRTMILAR